MWFFSPSKSSKALKALESEEESTSGDSEEDPEIVQKMAILSNKLQYLAKKNKKFLSRNSSHKSSRREEKGCFNCKKTGHFIAECPDLPKDKTKHKSKKPIFKSNKFKKQIKKSLMASWEDLDNESESEEEEAEDEAKIAMALVATIKNENESSDAESYTDSETKTQVYSSLGKTHFLQPCASSNKSKSTWVVFGRTSTAVCSCIFQVSFTTSASINTTS